MKTTNLDGITCMDGRYKTLIRLTIGFIFCLCIQVSYANDSLLIATRYYQAAQFNKALPILYNLAKKHKARNELSSLANCHMRIADILRSYGGANIAVGLLEENEKVITKEVGISSLLLADNYLLKSDAFFSATRFYESKEAIFQSISIKKQHKLPSHYLAEDYYQLARYYKEIPLKSDSCLYWANLSLRLVKMDKIRAVNLMPKIYNLLGRYYHPASIIYFRNDNGEIKKDTLYYHFNKSKNYYRLSIEIINNQEIRDKITLAKVYHNLGNSYNNEFSFDKDVKSQKLSLIYYRRSLEILEELGSPSDLAAIDWVIAVAFERSNNQDSALWYYQRGMKRLMPVFNPQRLEDVPPVTSTLNDKQFQTFTSQMLHQFQLKAKEGGSIDDLKAAYNYGIYAIEFYQFLIGNTQSEQETMNGFFLLDDGFYNRLTEVSFNLFKKTNDVGYLSKVYPYLVSSKYAFLNKPDFNPEQYQFVEENKIGKEMEIVKRNVNRNTTINVYELFSFLSIFKSNSSIIPQTGNATQSTSLDQIKNALDRESAFIDFFNSGKHIFLVTKDKTLFIQQTIPEGLKNDVLSLRNNMLKLSPREYAMASNKLYEALLDSVIQVLPNSIKHLIISPESYLQLVPWDGLVMDTLHSNNFKELNYLVNKYKVSTALTAAQLFKEDSYYHSEFKGIPSDFSDSKRFTEIPFSKALISEVSEDLNGDTNLSLYLDSGSFKVLHIASHVLNDNKRAFNATMFFSDMDSVKLEQLSNSKIRAKLCILNGCQTGSGAFLEGEGTISFGRAFYRMGAESVLMTLWNVDDKATADILRIFYNEMQNGNSLHSSIATAKREFIREAESDELANPFYWAGLQLSGKYAPIYARSYYVEMGLGLSLLIGLVIFIQVRRH